MVGGSKNGIGARSASAPAADAPKTGRGGSDKKPRQTSGAYSPGAASRGGPKPGGRCPECSMVNSGKWYRHRTRDGECTCNDCYRFFISNNYYNPKPAAPATTASAVRASAAGAVVGTTAAGPEPTTKGSKPASAAATEKVLPTPTAAVCPTDGRFAPRRGKSAVKGAERRPVNGVPVPGPAAATLAPAGAQPHSGTAPAPTAAAATAPVLASAREPEVTGGGAGKVRRLPRDPVLRSIIMVLDVAAAVDQAAAGGGSDKEPMAGGCRTRRSAARNLQPQASDGGNPRATVKATRAGQQQEGVDCLDRGVRPKVDAGMAVAAPAATGTGQVTAHHACRSARRVQPQDPHVASQRNVEARWQQGVAVVQSAAGTAPQSRSVPLDAAPKQKAAKTRPAGGAAAAAAAAAGIAAAAIAAIAAGTNQAPPKQRASIPEQALPVVGEVQQGALDADEVSRPRKRARKGAVQGTAHAAGVQRPLVHGDRDAVPAGPESGTGAAGDQVAPRATQAGPASVAEDRRETSVGVGVRVAEEEGTDARRRRKQYARSAGRQKAGSATVAGVVPLLQPNSTQQQVPPEDALGTAEVDGVRIPAGSQGAFHDEPLPAQQLPARPMETDLGVRAEWNGNGAAMLTATGVEAAGHGVPQAGASGKHPERQPVKLSKDQQGHQRSRPEASLPDAPQPVDQGKASRGQKKRRRGMAAPSAPACTKTVSQITALEQLQPQLQLSAGAGAVDGVQDDLHEADEAAAEVQVMKPQAAPATPAPARKLLVKAPTSGGVNTGAAPAPAATRELAAGGPHATRCNPPGSPAAMPAGDAGAGLKSPAPTGGKLSPAESVAQSNMPGLHAVEAVDKARTAFGLAEPQYFGVPLGPNSWCSAELARRAGDMPRERRPMDGQHGAAQATEVKVDGGVGNTPELGAAVTNGGQGAASGRRNRPIPPPPRFDAEPHPSQPRCQLEPGNGPAASSSAAVASTRGGSCANEPCGFFVQRSRDHGVKLHSFPQSGVAPEGLAALEAASVPAEAIRSDAGLEAVAACVDTEQTMLPDQERIACSYRPAASAAGPQSARGFCHRMNVKQAPCLTGSKHGAVGDSSAAGTGLWKAEQQWQQRPSTSQLGAGQRPTDMQQHLPNTADEEYWQGGGGLGAGRNEDGLQTGCGELQGMHGVRRNMDENLESGRPSVERQGNREGTYGAHRPGIPHPRLQAGPPTCREPHLGHGLVEYAGDEAAFSRNVAVQPGPNGFSQPRGDVDPATLQCPDRPWHAEQSEAWGPSASAPCGVGWPKHASRAAFGCGGSGNDQRLYESNTGEQRTRPQPVLQGVRYRPAANNEQQGSQFARYPCSDEQPSWQETAAAAAAVPNSGVIRGMMEANRFQAVRDGNGDRGDAMDVDYGVTDDCQFNWQQQLQGHVKPGHGQLGDSHRTLQYTELRQQPEFLACGPRGARSAQQLEFRQPLQPQRLNIGHGAEPGDKVDVHPAHRKDQNSFPHLSGFQEPQRNVRPSLVPQQLNQWHDTVLSPLPEGPHGWRSPAMRPDAGQAAVVQRPQQQQKREQQPQRASSGGATLPQAVGLSGSQEQQRPPLIQQQHFVVPALRSNRLGQQNREYAQAEHPVAQQPQRQQPQHASSADGRTVSYAMCARQNAADVSAPAPASSSAPSAAEVIRRALSRADEIQKRNKMRQQEIVEREEDGWTLEQVQELQTAFYKIDPTHPNFWCEVARNVHGRTAAECFSRVYASAQTRDERALIAKVLRRHPAPAAGRAGAGRPLTLAAARKWSKKTHELAQLERLARLGAIDADSQDETDDVEQGNQAEGPSTGGGRGSKLAVGARRWRPQLTLSADVNEIRSILDDLKQKHHADRFITSFLHKQGGWARWHKAVKEASERRQRMADAAGSGGPAVGGDSTLAGPSAKPGHSRDDTLARLIGHMLAKEKVRKQRQEWREDDRAEGLEEDVEEDVEEYEDEVMGDAEEDAEMEKEGQELMQYLVEEGLVGPDGMPVL